MVGLWYLVAGRGAARVGGGLLAAAAAIVVVRIIVTGPGNGLALELFLVLLLVSAVVARYAFDRLPSSRARAPGSNGRGTRC